MSNDDASSSKKTDTSLSSSSSVFQNLKQGIDVLEEKGFFNKETLSEGFQRIFGFDLFNAPLTFHEAKKLESNKRYVELIQEQKVYHLNGLCDVFDVPKSSIRKVQKILIKRGLIGIIKWTGSAKKSFGIVLYVTRNCSLYDIEAYMRDIIAEDEIRKAYEDKNTKKPEDVVDYNDEVSRLTKEKKEISVSGGVIKCEHGFVDGWHRDTQVWCSKTWKEFSKGSEGVDGVDDVKIITTPSEFSSPSKNNIPKVKKS